MPSTVWSASKHRDAFVPALLRSLHPGSREQAASWLLERAESLGLSGPEVEHTIANGAERAADIDGLFWPASMSTLNAARALLEILPVSKDWLVLGMGMTDETAHRLMSTLPPPSLPGSAPSLLTLRLPMPDGGTFLGFELLEMNSEYDGCSADCCAVEQEVFEHLHVRPNRYGLIDRWEDARLAAEQCAAMGWGEPVPYWPVALYRYEL